MKPVWPKLKVVFSLVGFALFVNFGSCYWNGSSQFGPPSPLEGGCKQRAKQVAFWTSGEIFILGSGWRCGGGGINAVIIMDVIWELHTTDSQHICSAGIRTSYVLIEIQRHLVGSSE